MRPSGGRDQHLFLVCYDYGMGGLWGVVMAPNEEAIKTVYPELDVVHGRPTWMTDERFQGICDTELHNVEGAPWGLLQAVLEDRRKREGTRLSPVVKERILSFSEYEPGIPKVAPILKDGTRVENVVVAGGDKVVRVGDEDGCPIVVAAVIDAWDAGG